ncbi:hypothetical protein BDW22DRAFT_908368 [Trametopsis cervina]|nr:hypothetical protein BDW22DRAFT_908368 [Trametopsis cervina]
MAANDTYDLLSLLPNSPYTLAYALPLFIVSLILTFAGCFLTLDRTSVFPSSIPSQAIPIATSSFLSRLHLLSLGGGIGGLCAGYAFGVHFSTLLSLALPSTTPTPTLSHKAFLAVWVVSALACLAVAGRWKYAAIAFTCLSG